MLRVPRVSLGTHADELLSVLRQGSEYESVWLLRIGAGAGLALLRFVRLEHHHVGGGWLATWRRSVVALLLVTSAGCEPIDPTLRPDPQLIDELGLTQSDRVHTVSLASGADERAEPDSIVVRPGDYLQFVSTDWLVHEVHFDSLEMDERARSFMTLTDQMDSPPLLQQGARFVVSFRDAPPGRYPFRLEGNRGPGRGVIVVAPPSGMP